MAAKPVAIILGVQGLLGDELAAVDEVHEGLGLGLAAGRGALYRSSRGGDRVRHTGGAR